jgi:uncharacterized protein YceK
MRAAFPTMLASLTAIALSGCGTVCNLAGGITHPDEEPRIYGGVKRDMEILGEVVGKQEPLFTESNANRADGGRGAIIGAAVLMTLGAADPVLSFVGDTLTLPITIPLEEIRTARQQKIDAGNQQETDADNSVYFKPGVNPLSPPSDESRPPPYSP